MLMDQSMNLVEKLVYELEHTTPENRDHFLNISMSLLKMATDSLERSPEFRQGFAKIHAEFLKYPESSLTLEEGIKAYKKYVGSLN